MPPESAHDQELSLKKRARRRLVGAVGLVLLMIIVLPMVLQDRASLAPNHAIKITMTEAELLEPALASTPPVSPPSPVAEAALPVDNPAAPAEMGEHADKPLAEKSPEAASPKAAVPVAEAKAAVKPVEDKPLPAPLEPVKPEASPPTEKSQASFTIQIGVYSTMANVTDLQAKLKQAGYAVLIKNVTTDKGEKIRLRTGTYASRQQAADALLKLQGLGLSGMVVANE